MPLRVVPRRDRKLHRAVKAAEMVPLRRGEILWRRGDPAGSVSLVRRGHLCLVTPGGATAAERTVGVVGPWEIAGEEALLTSATRRWEARAGETAAVQWLDAGAVTSALGTSRVTREAFLEAWMDDLALLAHMTSGSAGPDAAGRLASVVLHLARRLSDPVDGPPSVPLRLPHRTLADLAGLHRSTVTTILNDWIYEGWVTDLHPGLRLDDPEALHRLGGGLTLTLLRRPR